MLGNIVDHRTNPTCPEVDAVYEPSAHDNAKRQNGTEYFSLDAATADPAYFYAEAHYGTTVRQAVMRAEITWAFPVTIYLYDPNSGPVSV